jgi:hypothetical protein
MSVIEIYHQPAYVQARRLRDPENGLVNSGFLLLVRALRLPSESVGGQEEEVGFKMSGVKSAQGVLAKLCPVAVWMRGVPSRGDVLKPAFLLANMNASKLR